MAQFIMNEQLIKNLDLFVNQEFFSKKLIDNIPGVFYVYKEYKGVFRLFTCNKQHLNVTGYSAEESFNKLPLFFVAENSKQSIINGVSKIKTQNYVKEVYANFLTKSGKEVSYVFEGYGFNYKGESYFMGVGSDISALAQAYKDLSNERLERERKEKELLTLTLKDKQKEDVLASISKKLDDLKQNAKDQVVLKTISKLSEEINSTFLFSEDNWHKFELLFNNLHKSFYETLLDSHPNITKSEQDYCALIKLKMNTEQICNTLNISKEGLKKKKYRLKTKLGLDKSKRLETYINKF
ncbi:hypothetical protein [Xanthomarina sp. GH4-25]|uniref:hypothetical protein n=1 Tax=Xanthomarina sp. GH4-25 TaxID=3349335 RepID=UPI003877CF4E